MSSDFFNPALRRDDRKFSYCVLSGIQEARLDGEIIRGRFRTNLVERLGAPRGRLIEQFINQPDNPESILCFTLQNGPLQQAVAPDIPFEFEIQSFRRAQENFRKMWQNPDQLAECNVEEGRMRFRQGSITYIAATLESFLRFDLLTCPVERLKACRRDGCSHPYFIAGDLKRRFCSVECSEEGRREVKRDWWQKHGQKWDANRRSARRKGVNHGTHEEG